MKVPPPPEFWVAGSGSWERFSPISHNPNLYNRIFRQNFLLEFQQIEELLWELDLLENCLSI